MLYITGNMHGEMARFEDSRIRKLKKGDTLIVCGDFGFLWDGGAKEEKNLKKLGSKKYQILFVDGTHENFDLLEKRRKASRILDRKMTFQDVKTILNFVLIVTK